VKLPVYPQAHDNRILPFVTVAQSINAPHSGHNLYFIGSLIKITSFFVYYRYITVNITAQTR